MSVPLTYSAPEVESQSNTELVRAEEKQGEFLMPGDFTQTPGGDRDTTKAGKASTVVKMERQQESAANMAVYRDNSGKRPFI